jgi:hypothetical protein
VDTFEASGDGGLAPAHHCMDSALAQTLRPHRGPVRRRRWLRVKLITVIGNSQRVLRFENPSTIIPMNGESPFCGSAAHGDALP